LNHQRGHGWEYIQNELPGITQGDIDDVIRTPGKFTETEDGYRIIDDNPVGEGDLIVDIIDGVIIRVNTVLENYDDAKGVNKDVVLTKDTWERHIKGQQDHLSRSEIREVIEKGDEVYKNGEGLHMWVLVQGGVVKIARGMDLSETPADRNRIEIGTAFEPRRGYQYVKELVRSNDMYQIY